jgi:hypothetical protein
VNLIRRSQIIRLLETLNDGLPEPTRREHSTSGFVNEARPRTCPDCLANGRVMKTCETCKGSGTVAPAHLDAIALVDGLPGDGQTRDPYAVSDRVTAFASTTKLGHLPERDAEIDRARKLGRDRPTSEIDAVRAADADPYVWERDREARRKRFDYDAVAAALELLRDRDPAACSMLHAVYGYGWIEPSTTVEAAIARGLAFIDERMPDPIRAPGNEKHPALARRERRNAAA